MSDSSSLIQRLKQLSTTAETFDSSKIEEVLAIIEKFEDLVTDAIESLVATELAMDEDLIPPTEEFFGDEGIK